MKTLKKLTHQNLKLNKKRTLVTVIGIILSTALVSALATMFFSMRSGLIDYEKRVKGDYHYVFKNVPDTDFDVFKYNKKLENYYFVNHIGYAILDGIQNEYKPYVYVIGMDNKAINNLGINLIGGELPKNDAEIVIPEHLETNGKVKLNIGDSITLNIGKRIDKDGVELKQNNEYKPYDEEGNLINNEEIIDTTAKTYKIVGIVSRPSTNIENFSAPGYTFITHNDINNVKSADVYVRYNTKGLLNTTKTTAEILGLDYEKYANYVNLNGSEINDYKYVWDNAKYQVADNSYLLTLEIGLTNNSTINSLLSVCLIVTVIIVFTSVFCIKNSFDISITEKIRQYGMLRSVGATKKQIKKNVYYEGFLLGLFGIPLGILSGFFAAYILIIITNKLLFSIEGSDINLRFTFSWLVILVTILLGYLTIFLSARKSAKKASKISPIVAIRDSEEIKIKPKNLKAPKIIHKLFGVGGEISYKNLKRSRKKYRTTVISIIVCSSVFIALSFFMSYAFKTVALELNAEDYNITLGYSNKEEIKNKINELKELDSIKDYTDNYGSYIIISNYKYSEEYKKLTNSSEIDEESISLEIINKEKFQEYAKSLNLNYEDVKDKGIFKNSVMYVNGNNKKQTEISKYAFKKGDILTGKVKVRTTYETEDNKMFSKNEYRDINIELAKIVSDKPSTYANIYYDNILFLNEEYYSNLIYPDSYKRVYINSKDTDKTTKELEEIFNNNKDIDIFNRSDNAKAMQSIFILIGIFLYGFITVIALIGITNIFNTITTNMNLRRREFATLKSIGMTNKEFKKMIRLESLFYGVKSLIIGVPIGLLLTLVIYNYLCDGDYTLKYEIPYLSIFITCLVVFLLIITIMHYSIKKINKQNTIETIRNENI